MVICAMAPSWTCHRAGSVEQAPLRSSCSRALELPHARVAPRRRRCRTPRDRGRGGQCWLRSQYPGNLGPGTRVEPEVAHGELFEGEPDALGGEGTDDRRGRPGVGQRRLLCVTTSSAGRPGLTTSSEYPL